MMDITGKTALVTGANRGLGRAFADALLEAGASKVYAGARDPSTVSEPRFTAIRLDVTSGRDVAATAMACRDVEILINNVHGSGPKPAIDWRGAASAGPALLVFVADYISPLLLLGSRPGLLAIRQDMIFGKDTSPSLPCVPVPDLIHLGNQRL